MLNVRHLFAEGEPPDPGELFHASGELWFVVSFTEYDHGRCIPPLHKKIWTCLRTNPDGRIFKTRVYLNS